MSSILWATLLGLVLPLGVIFGGLAWVVWVCYRERRYWERRARRRAMGSLAESRNRQQREGERMSRENLTVVLWTAVILVGLAGLFLGVEIGIRAGSGFLGGLLGLVLGFTAGVLGARWSVRR